MLIGNNIIGVEYIVIDIAGHKATIGSYKIEVPIKAQQHSQFIRRNVYIKLAIIIPP